MKPGALVLGIAALFAAGGYAATGHPGLADRPHAPGTPDPAAEPAIAIAKKQLLQNTGNIGAWLLLSEAQARQGDTGAAVTSMQVALEGYPRSPDLWVGLGNALVMHARGQVTPAARIAFGRANLLDPTHPAPRYFLGLALLQAGKPAEALQIWQALAATSPAGAPWRADLERQIEAARAMAAMGVGS